MRLTVSPTRKLQGQIKLPSSKSYTIRAFLIASCGGVSTIIDPSDSEDGRAAFMAIRALGSHLKWLKTNICRVTGVKRSPLQKIIHVGESGTTLRLLLPLVALQQGPFMLIGEGTLQGRPNQALLDTLRKMGVKLLAEGPQGAIPISLQGGTMKGGHITIEGSLSSQFISALLIACPRLNEDSVLEIVGEKLVSTDFITMTLEMLKRAGIEIQQDSPRFFRIRGQQRFQGLGEFMVPSDYGLAAFHMAAAALSPSHVILRGYLPDDLIQADGAVLDLFQKLGIQFQKSVEGITMEGPFAIQGGDFSLKDCPDLVPIMAVLGLFAKDRVRLYDIEHVRTKESDRISDLRRELLKIGADIKESHNELIIQPKTGYNEDVLLNPHHDHRLAMAFCVLGTKLGATVEDIECTTKSYRKFVRDFKKLGVTVRKAK